MEDVILSLVEKSVTGAALMFLLYYLVKNMENIAQNLSDFGCSLQNVSQTLLKIDMRFEQLEYRIDNRIDKLEDKIKNLESTG